MITFLMLISGILGAIVFLNWREISRMKKVLVYQQRQIKANEKAVQKLTPKKPNPKFYEGSN